MNPEPLHLTIANIGAAIIYDKEKELIRISKDIDASTLREILRFCHLFTGLPKWIRSLNYLKSFLDQSKQKQESIKTLKGLEVFNQIYEEDSDVVLKHISQLDTHAKEWVIDYAYGNVLAKSKLKLISRERASVLILSLIDCPSQSISHLRSCLRHGVKKSDLIEDCRSFTFLKNEQKNALLKEINIQYKHND